MTAKVKYNRELLEHICERDQCKVDFDKIEKYNSTIRIEFICKCGKHYQKLYTMMYKIGAICNICTNAFRETKKKKTCLEKYGVENPNQNKEVRNKTKKTCLEKYGVEYSLQAQEIKNKSKEYFMKTYGVENASQVQENKDKKELKSLQLYGVNNISQSEIIKQKKIEKSLEKYGTYHTLQSKNVREKGKKQV